MRLTLFAVVVVLAGAGCGRASELPVAGKDRLLVVAAENFWGSILRQEGGNRVSAVSLISNPDADPHVFEPSISDAELVARADLFIFNGAGYDAWAGKLVAADPVAHRDVLQVATMGQMRSGNPHFWYRPDRVLRVATAVNRALARLDPGHGVYFRARHLRFVQRLLRPYLAEISTIRNQFSGVPIGATESIFAYMASALGLRLVSPPSFMKAISEGSEPTVADTRTFASQIRDHRIRVLVYNRQNATPAVSALVDEARAADLPVVPVTETLTPAGATFESWQTRQLLVLFRALRPSVAP